MAFLMCLFQVVFLKLGLLLIKNTTFETSKMVYCCQLQFFRAKKSALIVLFTTTDYLQATISLVLVVFGLSDALFSFAGSHY